LGLAGAGTFPRQAARARVLWIGLRGDVPALTRLAERCTAAARRTGIAVEERPLRPHLTLARARGTVVDLRDRLATLSSYDGPAWPLTSITLVHSTLGAQTRHDPLKKFSLASHPAEEH
jgi:2'-5' RNA ligase